MRPDFNSVLRVSPYDMIPLPLSRGPRTNQQPCFGKHDPEDQNGKRKNMGKNTDGYKVQTCKVYAQRRARGEREEGEPGVGAEVGVQGLSAEEARKW